MIKLRIVLAEDHKIMREGLRMLLQREGNMQVVGEASDGEREQDVLRFVALGFFSREIATRLGISIKTVDTHKTNAMTKMAMKNRIDIVRYAILQGWLQEN